MWSLCFYILCYPPPKSPACAVDLSLRSAPQSIFCKNPPHYAVASTLFTIFTEYMLRLGYKNKNLLLFCIALALHYLCKNIAHA